MEVLKIFGGLVAIGVFIVVFGTGGGIGSFGGFGGETVAERKEPVERGFSAKDSNARFVVAPGDN
jgi:hypothetical protein